MPRIGRPRFKYPRDKKTMITLNSELYQKVKFMLYNYVHGQSFSEFLHRRMVELVEAHIAEYEEDLKRLVLLMEEEKPDAA